MSKLFKPRTFKRVLRQKGSSYKMDKPVSKRPAPASRLFNPGFGMGYFSFEACG
ncbi:MAG TPA: hypothetical protein VK941_06160 [Gillisia sp.]|nr:hypothetical protein [Gillisia sp.]